MHPAIAAVRADLGVEGHVGRGVHQLPRDLAEPLGDLERVGRPSRAGAARPSARAGRGARAPWRRSRTPRASRCASLGSDCGSHGRTGGVSPTGTGFASNRTVARSTPETPSTRAWCVLRHDREAVVLEALHQPHLPQRLRAVELLREHPARELLQLAVVAGRGQGGMAHVVLDVEPRVVDPHRAARTAAAGRQASAGSAARDAGAPRRARRTRRSWAAALRRRAPRRCACARGRSPGSESWRRWRSAGPGAKQPCTSPPSEGQERRLL